MGRWCHKHELVWNLHSTSAEHSRRSGESASRYRRCKCSGGSALLLYVGCNLWLPVLLYQRKHLQQSHTTTAGSCWRGRTESSWIWALHQPLRRWRDQRTLGKPERCNNHRKRRHGHRLLQRSSWRYRWLVCKRTEEPGLWRCPGSGWPFHKGFLQYCGRLQWSGLAGNNLELRLLHYWDKYMGWRRT